MFTLILTWPYFILKILNTGIDAQFIIDRPVSMSMDIYTGNVPINIKVLCFVKLRDGLKTSREKAEVPANICKVANFSES